ncbi:MAG: hypothetical protein C4532_17670 [Candidatus Abyssobacteria bacterium SURF_17]|uniref:Uncharacterized protein n=1 Tax=Candidatus Abyssobacteria bacterium SURF_17 TaxID=2093361 RepID=A0A419EQI1_9BACT|nr:MAG: hypothetical protein C4532_17670 [Candidatus Abyssubacteria bacterium SURF_17]
MEVGTGLALLGSAQLIEKLLGPTAEYIGAGVKNWAEKRTQNVKRIFSIAARKLGGRIESEGAVPPKVLKGVLDEGSFCDDSLTAEYFGGVLASSRSGITRDDRGASFIALIGTLTTYQVRAHYLFYYILKKLFNGAGINVGTSEGRAKMETYVPFDQFVVAMDFIQEERVNTLMPHVMFGLHKERLIDDTFSFGSTRRMQERFPPAQKPGILFAPTPPGVELFLWAHGRSDLHVKDFFQPAQVFEIVTDITIPTDCQKTHM